jgi:CheY-like chemotaxis protein
MENSSKALEALFPGHRHGILRAMFMDPARWWELADLAGHLDEQPANLRKEVHSLCLGGVLEQRRISQRNYFRPCPACPFFAEIQGMVAKSASLEGHTGTETILVVEDEPATLKISRILLESWGYKVLEAHSAIEAVQVFERNRGEIRLLLTDVVMPGMTGPELGERLQAANPELKVIYMSGYHNDEFAGKNLAFLAKPFNPAGLARKIRETLGRD